MPEKIRRDGQIHGLEIMSCRIERFSENKNATDFSLDRCLQIQDADVAARTMERRRYPNISLVRITTLNARPRRLTRSSAEATAC